MTQSFLLRVGLLCTIIFTGTAVTALGQIKPGRDPRQPIDEQYTSKIREYTTQPFFNSPLTDYLPASPNVPTPKSVLGDVAGAPGKLPYAAEVYRYMRMLERASPRVKVFSIGTTEEGRERLVEFGRAEFVVVAIFRCGLGVEPELAILVAYDFPKFLPLVVPLLRWR